MPFYEIVYETGSKSVAFYEDDEEMLSAVGEHHSRAKAGEPGGPAGNPAERIHHVERYSEHPNEFGVSAEVVLEEVKEAIKGHTDENGVVDVAGLANTIRISGSPVNVEFGRQDSMFKMEAEEVITEGWDS